MRKTKEFGELEPLYIYLASNNRAIGHLSGRTSMYIYP